MPPKPGSSLEGSAEFENYDGIIWVEDVAGEVDALMAEGKDRAVVGFEFCVVHLGVLRGDSEAKPIERGIGELGPGIEKIVLAILHVEDVLGGTGKVEALV